MVGALAAATAFGIAKRVTSILKTLSAEISCDLSSKSIEVVKSFTHSGMLPFAVTPLKII